MKNEKLYVNFWFMCFVSVAMMSAVLGCAEFSELEEELVPLQFSTLEQGAFEESDETTLKADVPSAVEHRSTPFVNGVGPYNVYRTPSLVKAENGDILAFAGARDAHRDDSRGNIVMRRSSDGGRTWGPIQTIAGKTPIKNRNGLPSAVTLPSGKIILLYMWSKFVDHKDKRGCRKMYQMTSTDNGVTWSRRVDISEETQLRCVEDESEKIAKPIPEGNWGWTGLGPVHGIVLRHGPKRGRVLFAARHQKVKDTQERNFSHVIYSDDDGGEWHIGAELEIKSSEATVVELPNGNIMLNARSTGGSTNRIVGWSADAGESFYTTVEDETLIEPGCQASLLRYGRDDILFSNPKSRESKSNGTLRRSADGGLTWQNEVTYQAPEHFSGYSDMIRKRGDIHILVEWGPEAGARRPHHQIRYIVVPKEEIGL